MPKTPVSVEGKRHLKAMADVDTSRAARFQRRHSPACRELMYLSDGDGNGVCRYLGTSYGRQEWVNPALANRLQVGTWGCVLSGTCSPGLLSIHVCPQEPCTRQSN